MIMRHQRSICYIKMEEISLSDILLQKIRQITGPILVCLLGFTVTACSVSGEYNSSQTLGEVDILSVNMAFSEDAAEGASADSIDPNLPRTYTLSVNVGAPGLIGTVNNPDSYEQNAAAPNLASVTYYKTSYNGSSYDNVTFSVDNGTVYLEITPDISDSMLTSAYIKFELSEEPEEDSIANEAGTGDTSDGDIHIERGCYFYDPEKDYDSDDSDVTSPAYINDNGSIDLTQNPMLYVAESDGTVISYPIVTRRQTYDIPTLFLSTDSGEDVTSRYEYVSGNLILDGEEYSIEIRGRGNASWWKFPQQSYMLRFDEKTSLFGMIPSEKWVLASTYGDLSLIRNCVAMDIAACMEHLEYTPDQIPVDVYLNGEYLGIYTFSEKIDVDMQKLNLFSRTPLQVLNRRGIEDIAFLLECGGDLFDPHVLGQEYFYTNHSPKLFIEYPEFDEPYTDEFNYISNYMKEMDQAITRGYGYEEYIDVASWVDWFIVMELTNNTDSSFCRSSFIYKRPGERVMLGPVWDFDMAFGNFFYDNQTYAYWATAEPIYAPAQNHYMTYLYNSDAFMLAVRERWDEVKDELLATALESIDRYSEQVAASRIYNNHVRGVSNSGYQIDFLKSFVQRRYNWIDMSIHMSDFNRHPATESVPRNEEEDIPIFDENGNPVILPPNEALEAGNPEGGENIGDNGSNENAGGEAGNNGVPEVPAVPENPGTENNGEIGNPAAGGNPAENLQEPN